MNSPVIGNQGFTESSTCVRGGFSVWRDIDQGISYIVDTVAGTNIIIQSGLFHRICGDIDICYPVGPMVVG